MKNRIHVSPNIHFGKPRVAGDRVTFEIEPLGRNTYPQGHAMRLTVTHDTFPPGSKVYPGVCEGWPHILILSSLKSVLETGFTGTHREGLTAAWFMA